MGRTQRSLTAATKGKSRTLRYALTKKGREIVSAIIHVQHIPISKIVELAA